MLTIFKVLLPTDLSDLSAHAARFAVSLASRYGASLHVLHVAEPVIAAPPAPAPEMVAGLAPLPLNTAQLQARLDEFVFRTTAGTQVPVSASLVEGSIVEQIVDYVRQNGVDLVVIGTHARGVLRRILLGSISKTVMENAGCAVLMVPLSAPTDAGAGTAQTSDFL